MTRFGIRAASVAALVLTVISVTHPSFAQDDATKQARDHYQKGMVYFQNGDYPNAVAELKQAYQIKKLATLLFNIGQTYRKMDDTDMAIFYFDKFLKESPANAPQRAEAEKILGELRAKKGGGQVAVPAPLGEEPQQAQPSPQPAPQPAQQPQRRRRVVDKFEHREVEEAPPSTPLDVRSMLPEQEGVRATLYYRTAGQDNYTAVAMRPRYDEWVGRIPGDMIVGRSFQYYIEARDASGNVIGKSGSPSAPNIVSIVDGAKPQFYADLSEGMEGQVEEGQPVPVIKKGRRRHRGGGEEEGDEPEGPRTLHNFRTWKWTAAGVAGGTLLLGLISEIVAMNSSSTVESMACKTGCNTPNTFFNTDLQGSESTGQTFSTIGTISLIIGGLATAGAITLFVLDDSAEMEPEKRPGKPRRGLSLAPLVAPTPNGTVYGFAGGLQF
jgi:hypothetical protein